LPQLLARGIRARLHRQPEGVGDSLGNDGDDRLVLLLFAALAGDEETTGESHQAHEDNQPQDVLLFHESIPYFQVG